MFLSDGPARGWLEEVGCPVTVLSAGRTRQVHRTLSTIRRLAALARHSDVIISNQSKGHVYGGLAARIAGRPAVWWQQGIPERSSIETVAAAVPSAAVVVSSYESERAQRRLTPRRRIQLIHLGAEVQSIALRVGSGHDLRESLGWSNNQIVGIVGRLQAWKGQEVFLQAAAQLTQDHPDSRFVVVGGAILGWEGDYPQHLARLAINLGISERVYFAGHQDDVYPWFDAMDVVVHASFGEPFGLVLVEAMALAKPLVATAAGGPLEIIEDGVSGLLVPSGDADALAGAVRRLLSDSSLTASLSIAARERAEQFSSEHMARSFSQLLTQLHQPDPALGLIERTVGGLHAHVVDHVLPQHVKPGARCVDLGAGSGALALRLQSIGLEVVGADRDPDAFRAPVPFVCVNLDDNDWPKTLGHEQFDLVTAVEVIEHLEAPLGFLRGVARLLTPSGCAILTTPNVDSLPARIKFAIKGKLRMLDEHGDPTHISPIFWDLLTRKYLPLSGLRLVAHHVYPPRGVIAGRPSYRRLLRLVTPVVPRDSVLMGDNHVLVLAREIGKSR